MVVGETLSRYRLVAHLGSGAMGDVYRAEDQRLRRTVALKVVRAARDPEETSRRLLAEARAGSAFTHPNITAARGRHFCIAGRASERIRKRREIHNKEVFTFPSRRSLPGRSSGSESSISKLNGA